MNRTNITIGSVLDFIVALRGPLLHLEAVLLHYGAELLPCLAGYVQLKMTAVKPIQASQY